MTKKCLSDNEKVDIRTFDGILAFLNVSRILGFDRRTPTVEKDLVNTVNCRKFYFVTSSMDIWTDALVCGNSGADMVWVERDWIPDMLDASKAVEGTQQYFHYRGCSSAQSRVVGDCVKTCYPLYTSRIPCGCDLCLDGSFLGCPFLRERGGGYHIHRISCRRRNEKGKMRRVR